MSDNFKQGDMYKGDIMVNILEYTISDAATFWSAIEALATLGALIFLLKELPKIKREITTHKVEGVKFARKVLQSKEFVSAFKVIKKVWKSGGDKYPTGIDGYIVNAFGDLDMVATLVEANYIDKAMLFYEFGHDLFLLERFITRFEHFEDTLIPGIRATYPKAYELLKSATEYSRKRRSEISQRHEEYLDRN